jgi:hypothetical protein
MADYFGDISISSLASNDENDNSDLGSVQTVEIYQRLQDLEDMTANYLTIQPTQLNTENDSYADVDPNGLQEFEFKVGVFSRGDVLALSVNCLPNCMVDDADNLIDESSRQFSDYHPLEVTLRARKATGKLLEKDIVFKPSIHNGEYTFVITVAHGVTPGSSFILSVKNLSTDTSKNKSLGGAMLQAFRVRVRLHQAVRAIPLENGRSVTGKVENGEFAYYRFVCQDRRKLVSIRAKPLRDENGPIGDPDLYLSNKFDGLVAVTKDNCVWKSTNVGADRLDIHPADKNAQRGGTFIIGVTGYKELNEYELIAVMMDPEPIQSIAPGQKFDFSVVAGKYSFYSMKIDPRSRGKVLISVTNAKGSVDSDVTGAGAGAGTGGAGSATSAMGRRGQRRYESAAVTYLEATARAAQKYGRGIYTADELASYGLMPTDMTGEHAVTNGTSGGDYQGGADFGVTSLLAAAALTGGSMSQSGLQESLNASEAAARMLSLHSSDHITSSSYNSNRQETNVGAPTSSSSFYPYQSQGQTQGQSQTTSQEANGSHSLTRTMTLPASYCLTAGTFPVVYASTSCMYPSAHDYTWRVSERN